MNTRRGGRLVSSLSLLLCVAAVALPAGAAAQEQEPEMMLPGCAIMYPKGFDANTVGVVEGRVGQLTMPEMGPVVFRLQAGAETYTVLAAPSWFWQEKQVPVRTGSLVQVKGSKTMGADGELYLIAQQITVAGQAAPILFRDARGKPVWSGCGPRGCGRRGR